MLKLKWITPAIFSFSLAAQSAAPGNYSQVRSELNKISQRQLMDTLNTFVKESSPSRMIGLPGHQKARSFLTQAIKAADPKGTGKLLIDEFTPDVEEAKRFYQKDFDEQLVGKVAPTHPEYQKWLRFTTYMKQSADRFKSIQGMNIGWEKVGLNPKKVLLITAHYDTISHDKNTMMITEKASMPGANYNATGVTVGLALIKLLASMDLNYSVQVAFLDWQGVGFLGSYQHAKQLKNNSQELMGFINLEMLGQDTAFFDKTKKTGNMSVYYRPQDEKFVKMINQHGAQATSKVAFEMKPKGFANSDNVRYWDQGFTGATYTQNWEEDFNPKFYQTPQDTAETLNQQTFYGAYQFIAGGVIGTLLDITK